MSEEKEVKGKEKSPDDLDAVTKKWGLEAGLWKVRVDFFLEYDGENTAHISTR